MGIAVGRARGCILIAFNKGLSKWLREACMAVPATSSTSPEPMDLDRRGCSRRSITPRKARVDMFSEDIRALSATPNHIVVVGSGPVGLVVAMELAKQNHSVTMIESGLMEPHDGIQQLSEAQLADPRRNKPMTLAVQRRFGGTSNLWGAGCVPLDPIDFERRPVSGSASWPISYPDYAAYLSEACEYAGCGHRFCEPIKQLHQSDNLFTTESLIRYAEPASFRKAYAGEIAASPRITAVLGATVVGLKIGSDGRVAALTVRGHDGETISVAARSFVLACGGVETTRLLLAAQAEAPQRFGGENGPLGRFYMGHLSGAIADIRFDSAELDAGFDFFRLDRGAYGRRRLVACESYQHREGVGNVSFWPSMPAMADPEHRDPILSLAYLALLAPKLGPLLMTEALRKINIGDGDQAARHLWNVIVGLPSVAAFLPAFVYRRMLSRYRLPGLHHRNGARRYALHYHAEHFPNSASRIRLANEVDALGLRKVVVDLRFTAADAWSVVRSHEMLADWMSRTRLGELLWHHPSDDHESTVLELAGDGVHQIGTARMGENARSGVVDGNCRVFGSANLFLAGSAVFPTSGQANPTLSAMALGVRTARQVAREVAAAERAMVPVALRTRPKPNRLRGSRSRDAREVQ
jgi:choline dehydrogenase-like flavoprotein